MMHHAAPSLSERMNARRVMRALEADALAGGNDTILITELAEYAEVSEAEVVRALVRLSERGFIAFDLIYMRLGQAARWEPTTRRAAS